MTDQPKRLPSREARPADPELARLLEEMLALSAILPPAEAPRPAGDEDARA